MLLGIWFDINKTAAQGRALTGIQSLVARGGLGACSAFAGTIAVSSKRFGGSSRPRFDQRAFWTFLLSRLGTYCATFLLLRIAPRGDVPGYYYPEAKSVLAGRIPYRDILSSYAPLHSYMDAAIIFFWRSPLSIILFALLIEIALFRFWLYLGRILFSEERVRTAAILYIASPISLLFVAIDGQDNVVIALLLAIATYFMYKRQDMSSGSMLGFAASLVKFLPLLYVLGFIPASQSRLRWLWGCICCLILVYGGFVLAHAPIFYPLIFEGKGSGAGDLPFLIESLVNRKLPLVATSAVLTIALLIVFALIIRAVRGQNTTVRLRILTAGTAALTLALVIFSRKSWPPYLVIALFPICLILAGKPLSRVRLAVYSLWCIVCVTQHSFWATVTGFESSEQLHSLLSAGRGVARLDLLLQVVLLCGYGWLLKRALEELLRRHPACDSGIEQC